jgi:hypothetical protein
VCYDYNCFWDTRTATPDFSDVSFAEWQKMGRDKHTVIADPLFVDPGKYDFHIRNRSMLKKIKFKPFDYSKAGVYGNAEWTGKATMPAALEKKYDELEKHLVNKQ